MAVIVDPIIGRIISAIFRPVIIAPPLRAC